MCAIDVHCLIKEMLNQRAQNDNKNLGYETGMNQKDDRMDEDSNSKTWNGVR